MSERRYKLLDLLRGFSLLNMLLYHLLYDLVYLFDIPIAWYHGHGAYWWQQMICGSFILFSGFSCRLSRGNGKRGLLLLGMGLLLTLGTLLVMPSQLVVFGILHFMGISCLLLWLLRPLLEKVPIPVGIACSLFLFLLCRGVSGGYLGLFGHPLMILPRQLYQTSFLFPLGFPGPGFSSSDYFPILPWFFLFVSGFYLWPVLSKIRWMESVDRFLERLSITPLSWIGRHTLWIYMIHQPVLYGTCWLLRFLKII